MFHLARFCKGSWPISRQYLAKISAKIRLRKSLAKCYPQSMARENKYETTIFLPMIVSTILIKLLQRIHARKETFLESSRPQDLFEISEFEFELPIVHVPTLSPSSSRTWKTYFSYRPGFHPSSNWHLSHPCWKTWFWYQISDRYPIWISSAKSVLPFNVFFSHLEISQFVFCSSQMSFYCDCFAYKLTNNIRETIDSGKITILTALDMSDTLDHITFLS